MSELKSKCVELIKKGVVMFHLNNYQGAISLYDRAIKISPKESDAYNNKGIVLAVMGKLQEALECYEKAIEIN